MAKDTKMAMKWFISIVASAVFVFSTVFRVLNGQEVDKSLCMVFAFIAGLPWGANVIDYFKK